MPNTGRYCENPKARVCWGHMATDPATYFSKEDQPAWVTLKDPSHLRQEEISMFWDFWYSCQLAGKMGLVFSGCDKRDKRNHMGAGKKFFQAHKKAREGQLHVGCLKKMMATKMMRTKMTTA